MIYIKIFSKYKKYFSKISLFFDELNSYTNKYISKVTKLYLQRKYNFVYLYFKYKLKNKHIHNFIKIYSSLDSFVELHNSIYLKNELQTYENLLNNIDGKSLDFQQKMAVLSDEKNNLIIAGAGSGKTLTISGKVKYLIESRKSSS